MVLVVQVVQVDVVGVMLVLVIQVRRAVAKKWLTPSSKKSKTTTRNKGDHVFRNVTCGAGSLPAPFM